MINNKFSEVIFYMFTCAICGADKQKFAVQARGKFQTITYWLEYIVRPTLKKAHLHRSPTCTSTKCDLYLPMSRGRAGYPSSRLN